MEIDLKTNHFVCLYVCLVIILLNVEALSFEPSKCGTWKGNNVFILVIDRFVQGDVKNLLVKSMKVILLTMMINSVS